MSRAWIGQRQGKSAAALPVITQQKDHGHSALKSSGTSPNFFSTTASENSPTFGSPARLNATAPALAGSRDIPSAPPDRGCFALALLCLTWRGTVFGSDEWEGNGIG